MFVFASSTVTCFLVQNPDDRYVVVQKRVVTRASASAYVETQYPFGSKSSASADFRSCRPNFQSRCRRHSSRLCVSFIELRNPSSPSSKRPGGGGSSRRFHWRVRSLTARSSEAFLRASSAPLNRATPIPFTSMGSLTPSSWITATRRRPRCAANRPYSSSTLSRGIQWVSPRISARSSFEKTRSAKSVSLVIVRRASSVNSPGAKPSWSCQVVTLKSFLDSRVARRGTIPRSHASVELPMKTVSGSIGPSSRTPQASAIWVNVPSAGSLQGREGPTPSSRLFVIRPAGVMTDSRRRSTLRMGGGRKRGPPL